MVSILCSSDLISYSRGRNRQFHIFFWRNFPWGKFPEYEFRIRSALSQEASGSMWACPLSVHSPASVSNFSHSTKLALCCPLEKSYSGFSRVWSDKSRLDSWFIIGGIGLFDCDAWSPTPSHPTSGIVLYHFHIEQEQLFNSTFLRYDRTGSQETAGASFVEHLIWTHQLGFYSDWSYFKGR